jgi:hypothetical protein
MATQDSNTVGALDAKIAKSVRIKKTTTPAERDEAIRHWKEVRKNILPLGMSAKDFVNEGRP